MPKSSADLIAEECDALKALLLRKNAAYGDSALDPVRIFSRADALEQIRVRIDDKLCRIARVDANALGEDAELDLLGYIVLLRVARLRAVERQIPAPTLRDLIGDLAPGIAQEFASRVAPIDALAMFDRLLERLDRPVVQALADFGLERNDA